MEHVTKEFERQMAGSGRLIELHGTPSGCRIEADREALSIALRNLVDNALKYSPDQPTVWVEWGREQDSVAIRVRDQGPGIPASERKAIFHKFVRGSAAATGGVKGMGVGLAMVHHIVVAHGGEIPGGQRTGQGSTFTMLAAGGEGSMTRILVVEDEPAIALGLEDDLKMEGYEVEVVGNAGALRRRGILPSI